MEGVIPNSKVVILPSVKEGEAWKRQLFLRPGEWIPWVTLTVVVGTILLAAIVFILHLNEKVRGSSVRGACDADTCFVGYREKMNWNEGGRHIISILTHCDGQDGLDLYAYYVSLELYIIRSTSR